MRISERDRSRLDALFAIIKPSNSLAARLDTLTDYQRQRYERWQIQLNCFIEQHPDGEAYELSLQGIGPNLINEIRIALFNETPRILVTDNDQKAQEIYWKYCNG